MLTKRFLLYFLLPAMLLLVGVEFVSFRLAQTSLREEVDRNLLAMTEALDAEISARFDNVRSDLRVISANPAFDQYYQFARLGQVDSAHEKRIELEADFLSVAALKPGCVSIRFFAPDGRSLASVVGGERSFKAVDVSRLPWFREARTTGPATISKTAVDAAGSATLIVSQALLLGDERHVLAIEVDLDALVGNLIANRVIGRKGHAYVVGPSGRILLHADESMVGRDVSGLRSTRGGLRGYQGVTTAPDGSGELMMRKGYMPLTHTDLALVVALPQSEVLEPVLAIRRIMIPLTVGGFVLLALFGAFLVARVISPIQELSAAAGRVSEGQLDVTTDVRSGDELEELSTSFNRMTRSLKAGRESIERQNEALVEAAEALRESEENLSITLDSIGDGVIATDREGRITRLNATAENLTGFPGSEARGQRLGDIFRIIDGKSRKSVADPVEVVLQTGKRVGLTNDTVLVARDGEQRQIADSGAPIRNASGEIVGVVLVFRDMTERYEMEARLRHAQKMDSIGLLAGGVAHDFNNLLTVIIGNADLLQRCLPAETDGEAGELVTSIQEAARRGADLTSQLLAFSRRGKVAMGPLDLHQVIARIATIGSRTFDKRLEVRTELEASAAWVMGDESALENAVLNLALNARDAMPRGGVLTFSTANAELDEAACRRLPGELRPGNHVVLTVSDTGHGMDRETRERVFEPFFTTKKGGKGTGLGLAAVYGTLASHDGAIEVQSEVGHGSTMNVFLPVVGEDESVDAPGTQETVHGEGRILLVDDEPEVLAAVSKMISLLGYEVVTATDGDEALAHFAEDPAAFDLVLLDMILPKESGREVLERLLEVRRDTRVLLVSGYAHGGEYEEALRIGAIGLLRKPFRIQDVSSALSRALGTPT